MHRFAFWLVALIVTHSYASAAETILLKRADGNVFSLKRYGDWNGAACAPTVILSHGMGGDKNAMGYVGEYLAPLGYRVAVMEHKESGRRALLKTIVSRDKDAVLTDPIKHQGRFMDLEASFAYVTKHCRPNPLILGGHSMGAGTTMLEAGAKGKVPLGGLDRFDAYIALSPQGVGWLFNDGAWRSVRKPVLMVTGTKDSGYDGDYTTRLAAFEGLPAGNKRLAIIGDTTHLNIGGRGNKAAQHQAAQVMIEYLEQIAHGGLKSSALTGIQISDK